MNLPTKPPAWANKISGLLQAIEKYTGEVMYPVKIQDIAVDISRQFFPDSPITQITGEDFSGAFEGALARVPNSNNEWGIAYNTAIKSKGRINFTLAHEFGHYLLHRSEFKDAIKCNREDMFRWDSEYGKRESEANEFASYLLMPRNLFEAEMKNDDLSLHLFQHVADYFNVSLTAALLKWLSFTTDRAMLVVGRDGFIDWVWSSEQLRKSGVYLQPKKQAIELPRKSLAAKNDLEFDTLTGVTCEPGIWPFKEEVHEMTVHADTYDMTITLLVFPKHAPSSHWEQDKVEHGKNDSYRAHCSCDNSLYKL
jgi:hypothetical protein